MDTRMWNAGEVAQYLGVSLRKFRSKQTSLFAAGFPRPNPVLKTYDRFAIDDWLSCKDAQPIDDEFGL